MLQATRCPHGRRHDPGEIDIRAAMERLHALNAKSATIDLLSEATLSGLESVFAFLERVLNSTGGFVSSGGNLDLDVWAPIFTPDEAAAIRAICQVPANAGILSAEERAVGLCRLVQAIHAYAAREERR
jgi:hypothetical protein